MFRVNQLSGFGGKRRRAFNMSIFASATDTDETVVCPAGVRRGDVLFLWHWYIDTVNIGEPPTDFTEIVDLGQTGNRGCCASYKIADGTEGGTTITVPNSAAGEALALYVLRGNRPVGVVTIQDLASQADGNNPTAQVVNASGGALPLAVFGCYGASGTVDPRNFTPAADAELAPVGNMSFKCKIYNSSPADTTVDMDDEGNNLMASFYAEFTALHA